MIDRCIKSPICRMGGKFFLRDWLHGFIPRHTLYCEPFAGAAHLLFSKSPSKVEVINDIDGHLIGFFQVIKDREKRLKLVETLQYMPYGRSLWNELRSQWKAGDIPQDEVVLASQWFYLNWTCFGGDQRRGGFAAPSTTGRNPVQSFRSAVKTFEDVSERIQNVCIEHLDYADSIRRYDSPDTLHYIDPPYLDAGHYYGKDFTLEDHHRLSELLHTVKGMVMISHYADPVYDELYNGWNKYIFESFKGCSKASSGESKPKTHDFLFTNFEPPLRNKMLTGF